MKQPKPRTISVVCDQCGLDWNQHNEDAKGKVTLDECVRLLKVELTRRPYQTYPYYVPTYPQPWVRPIWYTTGTASPNTTGGMSAGTVTFNTTSAGTAIPAPKQIEQ